MSATSVTCSTRKSLDTLAAAVYAENMCIGTLFQQGLMQTGKARYGAVIHD